MLCYFERVIFSTPAADHRTTDPLYSHNYGIIHKHGHITSFSSYSQINDRSRLFNYTPGLMQRSRIHKRANICAVLNTHAENTHSTRELKLPKYIFVHHKDFFKHILLLPYMTRLEKESLQEALCV